MSRTLLDTRAGETVTIAGLAPCPAATRQRLLDMGLTRGAQVVIRRLAPLGDPVKLEVKGYTLAIRKREASLINVSEEEPSQS